MRGSGGSLALTPRPRPRHSSKHFPGAAQGRTGLRGPRRTEGADRDARTEGSSPDTLGLLAAHPQEARCPAHLSADLIPALARLDVHNLPHGGRRLCALGTGSSDRGGDCGPATRSQGLDPLPALHPDPGSPTNGRGPRPPRPRPLSPRSPQRLQSPHPRASPSPAAPPPILAGLGPPFSPGLRSFPTPPPRQGSRPGHPAARAPPRISSPWAIFLGPLPCGSVPGGRTERGTEDPLLGKSSREKNLLKWVWGRR